MARSAAPPIASISATGVRPAPGQVRPDIWVVSASGGTPRRLTLDPSYETMLAWAADSASVYFMSDRTGAFEIWNRPIDGGSAATRVTHGGGLRAQESRDGRFFYYANDVHALRATRRQRVVTAMSRERRLGEGRPSDGLGQRGEAGGLSGTISATGLISAA